MSLLNDARKKLAEKYSDRDEDEGLDEDVTIRASKLSPGDFREVLRLGLKHHQGAKMAGAPGGEGPAEGTDECPHCGRSGSEDIMDRGHRESYTDDTDDSKVWGD
jgi:hypothetical protein